jgi:hypothetical protein
MRATARESFLERRSEARRAEKGRPFVASRIGAAWFEGVVRESHLLNKLKAAKVQRLRIHATDPTKEPKSFVACHKVQ